jgi:Zn-dependent peptidase ImmA (M78 family)
MNPTTIKTPPAEPNLIRAQGAAFRLNKRFVVTQPGELELEAVAMALGVLVFVDKLDGATARLARKGQKGVIRVSDRITVAGAQRFAIAHELGHWEQHGEYSQLFLCTEADMRDYGKSVLEIEANTFAAELLMPAVLFRPFCENVDPSLTLVGNIAEHFRTSRTATTVRFVNETQHKCFVVYSENGRIKWWKRKERATHLWLNKDQQIHPHSMAWECLQGGNVPGKMESVPVEAWFSHLPFELNAEVMEQSVKLGRFPGILTLLWVIQ